MRKNKGITLIALIITIIVLLILTGVTLNMIMEDSGIFRKANIASEETKKSQALEKLRLKVLEVQAQKEGKATLNDVFNQLKDEKENISIISNSSEQICVKYKEYKFKITNKFEVFFLDDETNIPVESDNEKDFAPDDIEKVTNYNHDISETIPVLTSKDSDEGYAFASSCWSGYPEFYAFDNSLLTAWNPDGKEGLQYLGFCYKNPMVIKRLELQFPKDASGIESHPKWCLPNSIELMASNDGINYVKISDFQIEDKYTKEKVIFPVNNEIEYLYYKIEYNQETSVENGGDDILIGYLQFYGYEQYYEAIEPLTSEIGKNVSISASSTWDPHLAYKAFDGNIKTGWNASGDSVNEQYIECNFYKATKVKGFLIQKSKYNNLIDIPKRIYFKTSNDGINYNLLGTYDISDEMQDNRIYYKLDNNNYYKHYKIEYNQEIAQKDGGPDIMFGIIQMFK